MFEKISIMDYLELKIEALSYSKKYLFVGPHGDIGVVFHHWKSFPWACLFLLPGTSDPFKNRCKLNSFSEHVLANNRAEEFYMPKSGKTALFKYDIVSERGKFRSKLVHKQLFRRKFWISKINFMVLIFARARQKIFSRLDSEPDNPKEVVASNGQMKIEALS